jgi:hypothetical protein
MTQERRVGAARVQRLKRDVALPRRTRVVAGKIANDFYLKNGEGSGVLRRTPHSL